MSYDDGLSDIRELVRRQKKKIEPGDCFKKRYRILRRIGQGGMGKLYQARDLERKCLVAMKIFPLSWNREQTKRFEREFEFLSSVNHPNLVAVYDFFAEDERLFLVIEFVPGESLQELITNSSRRLSLAEQIAIANQISRAVEALNSQGIIHRDVKPANIMLDFEHGCSKLLDLGLAKGIQQEHTYLTKTGSILGTPAYLSPEQIEGEVCTNTDVFALGVTFYQFFSWHPHSPFYAKGRISAMANVAQKQLPPLRETLNFVEESDGRERKAYDELSRLLAGALEKKPQNRLATASSLANSLHDIYFNLVMEEQEPKWRPTPAVVVTHKPRTKKRWAIAAAIVLLLWVILSSLLL